MAFEILNRQNAKNSIDQGRWTGFSTLNPIVGFESGSEVFWVVDIPLHFFFGVQLLWLRAFCI